MNPVNTDRVIRRLSAKVEENRAGLARVVESGSPGAPVAIVAYGITARAAAEATARLAAAGRPVHLVTLKTLWPFPLELVAERLARARRILVPEMNLGQLALEVERACGRDRVRRLNKVNSEVIFPGEIVDEIAKERGAA